MRPDELKDKICEAARKAFSDLRSVKGDEDFYAYALYTDSSVMTVVPAANSEQRLDEVLAGEDDKSHGTYCYYKWAVSEWAYESWKAEAFKEISTYLRTSPERDSFPVFRETVINTMTAALNELRQEGLFGDKKDSEKIVLFISMTDDDSSEEIENNSAKALNSTAGYERFIHRYD